jgi:hypothetical protein
VVDWVSPKEATVTEPLSRFQLDLSSNSCRIRLDGTKPGKQVKVLVRDKAHDSSPSLHGTGVLSEDSSVFTASFPSSDGEETLVIDWKDLKAELAKYPRYD